MNVRCLFFLFTALSLARPRCPALASRRIRLILRPFLTLSFVTPIHDHTCLLFTRPLEHLFERVFYRGVIVF